MQALCNSKQHALLSLFKIEDDRINFVKFCVFCSSPLALHPEIVLSFYIGTQKMLVFCWLNQFISKDPLHQSFLSFTLFFFLSLALQGLAENRSDPGRPPEEDPQ